MILKRPLINARKVGGPTKPKCRMCRTSHRPVISLGRKELTDSVITPILMRYATYVKVAVVRTSKIAD